MSLAASAGAGIIGVVAAQVLLAIVQGVVLRPGEWGGVPDDLVHRLGFPFGGLGATAPLFVIVGLILVALPDVLGEPLTEGQDRVSGFAVTVGIGLSVVLMLGAVLAARGSVQQYAARVPGGVPSAVMVQFVNALLGALGASALALFTAVGLRRLRASPPEPSDR